MSTIYYLFITQTGVKKSDSINYKFGECVSSHKSYVMAGAKAAKINNIYGTAKDKCVLLYKAHSKSDKYKPGTVYKKTIKDLVQKQENEDRAEILNKMIDIKTLGEPPCGLYLKWITEDWGFNSFESFHAKYIDLANKLRDESERLLQQRADKNAKRDAVNNGLNSSSEICYNFPAVLSIQGGKSAYLAAIPILSLVKIFNFDEDFVPAEFRSQRQLNEGRAKAISDYVLDNIDSYVLPALTATISEEMVFKPFEAIGTNGRLGMLSLPLDSIFNIVDGQHRLESFRISLKEAHQRSLGNEDGHILMQKLTNETISVQIHFDSGLKNSQQIFSDINSGMVRPSTSISALYNHRDPFNKLVLEVLDLSPSFKAKIDMENNTVGKKSTKLFSLVAVMKLVNIITGINSKNYEKLVNDDAKRQNYIASIANFIDGLNHLRQWDSMLNGVVCGPTARNELITAQTVFLHGLAIVGNLLFSQHGYINVDDLKKLSEVDVMKAATCWNNRCVVNGKMVVTTDSKKAIAGYLCRTLSVPMSDSIKEVDAQYDVVTAA